MATLKLYTKMIAVSILYILASTAPLSVQDFWKQKDTKTTEATFENKN